MTTTVTTGVAIGTGGLVAGSALAVAGAASLGLLGLAKLSSGGGGKKGSKKGHHRYQRSALEESNVHSNALNLIRQEDFTGCGLKLMCELAGMDREELAEVELAIVNLVGPTVRPGEGVLPGGVGDYTLAKSLGEIGTDCGQAFPLCSLSGTQLMDTVMGFLP